MPDARIVIHVLPSCYAGKKRIHDHQLFRLRGKLRGVGVGHHQPDVVTDHPRFLDAERLGERVDPDGGSLHV